MSAVTWDEIEVTPRGGHLHLVRRGHLHVVPTEPSGLALTTRGRVVLALLVLLVVGVMATWASASASNVPTPSTVTVVSGETLSEISLRELPSLPIREGVARIQILNNLSTTSISAGQSLLIPKI